MNVQLERLIELQETDREIGESKRLEAEIPKQVESARTRFEEKRTKLQKKQDEIKEFQKKRNQLELDAQAERDRMAKTRGKLPTVKTNKEYSALLTEIEGIQHRVSQLEDRELEIMETLDEMEKEVPLLKSQVQEEEDRFHEYRAKKENELNRVKRELDDLRTGRVKVRQTLEPKWAQSYEKVFKLREGQAVVPLQDGTCQGCYQQVRPQLVIEIKSGEQVIQCQSCSRFLYWISEQETETAMPK